MFILFFLLTVQLFAKKTGDYRFLSATDIKLIALTYQLEKEIVGTDHLRTEPIIACKSVEPLSHKGTLNCPGFYMPDSVRALTMLFFL